MTTPKCPDCQAPLWLRACKCGWQAPVAELKFSDDAYARQAALYASQVDRPPALNPFEVPHP